MSSESDMHDYVMVPYPGETVSTVNNKPPHIIQEIKKWLSPTDTTSPASEYHKHLNSHAPGTGDWILNTDQYRRWSSDTTDDEIGGLLWIRGIPGSGKSVVAASMVKRLQQQQQQKQQQGNKDGDGDDAHAPPVLFFFFREIIEANRSSHSLSRDFCHGLLDHSPILQSMLENLKSKYPGVETVPFYELWKCLLSALDAIPKVYCVVDALDEMEPGHDQFLLDLLHLGQRSPKSIKVILTSRQLLQLEKHLGNCSSRCLLDLRLDRRNMDRDIAIYISQRLESETTLAEDEASEIKKAICDRGKGLFLYARLVTNQLLLHYSTPTSIVHQLSQLPDGLGSMYTNILRDHAARSQTSAEFQRLVLEWVVFSARPLRLLELATMVDSLADRGGLSENQNTKSAVRSTCGPLLEVCEDGVIQIIHHSLTEFLLNSDASHVQDEGNSREFAVLDSQVAHGNIARTCVNYITRCHLEGGGLEQYTEDIEFGYGRWQRSYLLRYASAYWPYHAAKADQTKEFMSFLDGFFNRTASFTSWAMLWGTLNGNEYSNGTPLHVAANSGLCAYTKHLLVNGADPECLDEFNRTPLTHAAFQGYSEIAQSLLEHEARYDLVDDDMMAPIHYAAKMNRAKVVRVLLTEGADPLAPVQPKYPNRPDSYRRTCSEPDKGETPLSYACRLGHVQTLMELLRYIDPLTLRRGFFLHLAARNCHVQIVNLLLGYEEVRLGINDHDHNGNTALYLAAKGQGSEVVHVLLEKGADISFLSLERGIAKSGRCPGASSQTGMQNKKGFTPLHGWAGLARLDFHNYRVWKRCGLKSRAVLELLIRAGCDVNATDHKGRTALFAWEDCDSDVSDEITVAFISLLLENGADALVTDLDGASPLHQIAQVPYCDYGQIVELFINAGADINATRNTDGMTPVHLIAKESYITDPTLLSQLKADFKKRDLLGNTPLHYVCYKWYRKISNTKAWLSLGDLNNQNNDGLTPLAEFLEHSSGYEKNECLSLYVEYGANLECRDYQGRTALLTSLSKRFTNRRQLILELLRLGADVKATDFRGKSALHYAASPGEFSRDGDVGRSVSLLRLLIDAGADINGVDHDGNSIFHDTIAGGWQWARYRTEALIELNAPLHLRNYQGRTALHSAAAIDSADNQGRVTTKLGSLTRIEFLLHPELGFDINAQDHQGVTPLHLAAATSDINARQLISLGADIHAKTIHGRTALHYAGEVGQSNSVGLLLEAYRNQPLNELRSVEGRTALHEAAKCGRYESVKLLLDAGSRPDICDKRGRSPLHAAAEFDQISYFRRRREAYYDSKEKQALVEDEHPDKLRENNFRELGLIISNEEDSLQIREVVRLLLAAGVDPAQRDNDEQTASDVAVILGSSDVVDELTSVMTEVYASTDNSSRRWLPLDPVGEALSTYTRGTLEKALEKIPTSAYVSGAILKRVISTGNVRAVEELLCSSRVNLLENDIVSALHLCVRWGLLSMAKALLSYVLNLDGLLPSLLDSATERSLCNIEIIKLLIQKAVRVSRGEEFVYSIEVGNPFNSSSALHRLSSGKYWWYPKALTMLLEAGADTELLIKERTPLQTALQAGSPCSLTIGLWCDQAFDILVNFGADVNAGTESGISPLLDALKSGRDLSLVQKLLDRGASLEVEGKPAIAAAINAENTAALELLLKAGANPNVFYATGDFKYTNQLKTPLEHSSEKRNEGLMELLLAYGATPHQQLRDGASSVLHEICSWNGRVNPIITAGYDLEKRDAQGRTPLMRACSLDERSLVYEGSSAIDLIHAGVDVNPADYSCSTALHYAACLLLDNVAEELLQRGASPVARNKHGLTPFHCALNGQIDLSTTLSDDDIIPSASLIRRLLAAGANPLELFPDGRTALHYISPALMHFTIEGGPARRVQGEKHDNPKDDYFLEHSDVYQKLIDAGCSREARDNKGSTPIFAYVRTVRHNSEVDLRFAPDLDDMRRMFEEHDIHAVNDDGETLLHAVAGREEDWDFSQVDDVMIFKLLVELGLDPEAENKDGATPLDVAAAWERDEILALFARDE